eukprot:9983498-Alexandrium_andersonii.AAC.1
MSSACDCADVCRFVGSAMIVVGQRLVYDSKCAIGATRHCKQLRAVSGSCLRARRSTALKAAES